MIRKAILILIVAVGLASIALVSGLLYSQKHLKTCFVDAQGLRAGAAVRIAGVEVGRVRRIHVDPAWKACPAEIEMGIAAPYEIKIPRDSLAGVARAGILGEAYVEIDTANASGPPLEEYGYLSSKTTAPDPSVQDYLKAFESAIGRGGNSREQKEGSPGASALTAPALSKRRLEQLRSR